MFVCLLRFEHTSRGEFLKTRRNDLNRQHKDASKQYTVCVIPCAILMYFYVFLFDLNVLKFVYNRGFFPGNSVCCWGWFHIIVCNHCSSSYPFVCVCVCFWLGGLGFLPMKFRASCACLCAWVTWFIYQRVYVSVLSALDFVIFLRYFVICMFWSDANNVVSLIGFLLWMKLFVGRWHCMLCVYVCVCVCVCVLCCVVL